MMNLRELEEKFNNHIKFQEKRPGILQVYSPIYREDGDMVDVFIEETSENKVRICDHGLTLMRLSYEYEIDSPKKEEIFYKILNQNLLNEENGNIYIETEQDKIYSAFMQFTQGVSKISSMQYFKREIIRDLFYENLKDFVYEKYVKYNLHEKYYPLENKTEYEVDYLFDVKPYPVFIFGVKEEIKAKNVAISCRQFLIDNLTFKSVVIYEDLNKMPKKDIIRLASAVDKQFVSFGDFKENSEKYFQKEIAA